MSAPPTFLTARGAGPRRRSRAWPEGRGLPWGRTRSGFRTNTAGRGTPRPAQLRASQNVGKPHVSLPWQNPSRTRTQDPQSLEPAPTERRAQQEAVSPNSPPICPPRSEKTEKLEELLGSRWSGSCLLLVRPTEQSRVPSPRCPSNTLGLCRVPGRTRSGPGQARSPPTCGSLPLPRGRLVSPCRGGSTSLPREVAVQRDWTSSGGRRRRPQTSSVSRSSAVWD